MDWNMIAGELITQVLKILLPIGIALILKWAGELWLKVKEQKPEIAELLNYAVSIAVRAAEQEFGGEHGAEKKAYAIEFVQKFLAENGVMIDVSVIASAIESAVFGMNAWMKPDAHTDNAE